MQFLSSLGMLDYLNKRFSFKPFLAFSALNSPFTLWNMDYFTSSFVEISFHAVENQHNNFRNVENLNFTFYIVENITKFFFFT